MIIKKKYKQIIDFIKIFNRFTDNNSLVEITEDEYNILAEFVSDVNNIDYDGEPEETGNYATVEYVNNKINEVVNNLPNVPNNVVTSNTENLKLDIVASMPETPNENTLYVIQ
jgi:hypothetical protein